MRMRSGWAVILILAAVVLPRAVDQPGEAQAGRSQEPLVVAEQGALTAGGEVRKNDVGLRMDINYLYAQYQKPVSPRQYSLVMWHGGGQHARTYLTTPDGREGYDSIFVRRGFSVYVIDQPGRARGGASDRPVSLPAATFSRGAWESFRWGTWLPGHPPTFYPGVQISRRPEHIDQYYQQWAVNTAPGAVEAGDPEVAPAAVAALFEKIGPGVLITHSASGYLGWLAALKNDDIKAVVSYEPVRFVFPEGEVPPLRGRRFVPMVVSRSQFAKLTKVPIQIVYGDFLDQPGQSEGHWPWDDATSGAEEFVAAVNKHGGDAQVLYLAKAGLKGNTHFPFSDLNNLQVADLLSTYLRQKGLDGRDRRNREVQGRAQPLVIAEQGVMTAGGTVRKNQTEERMDLDYLFAQYQKPVNPREHALVMWHGGGQHARTYLTTPDGREGYDSIFLRRGFSVYVIDQPGRARGSRSDEAITIPGATYSGPTLWEAFRWGTWVPPAAPTFYPGVQISQNPKHIDQYYQQGAVNIAPGEFEAANAETGPSAMAALLQKTGPSVLITHSAGGYVGWLAGLKSNNVKGIVSYEPVRFVFPEGEVPPLDGRRFVPLVVSKAEFSQLTKFPIQIVYGDFLDQPGQSKFRWPWPDAISGAEEFVAAVNKHGGDAQVLYLAKAGLRGNTHFPFSDLNNHEVADLLSGYLKSKGLDRRP
jgi:hypothetical protein